MQRHDLQTTVKSTSHPSRPALERQTEVSDAHGILSPERDPLAQVSCRLGDASCVGAHASTLNHATASRPTRGAQSLLQLQRQYGNRYVQRVLALARKADGEAEAAPEVEASIQQARGSGQALDSRVRAQMESAFGADFSGVRVHADAEADTLSRALSARAFTTGQDIFLRQGEYNPGTSSGRELLAHELTHVVQQAGSTVQGKLVIGQPGDMYEQEADRVAEAVIHMPEPRTSERVAVPGQAQQSCPACEEKVYRKSLEEELEEEGLRVPPMGEATVSLQRAILRLPLTDHRLLAVQRSIEDAFDNYRGTCDCGEDLGNDCAHYLSDAFVRAGYTELDGGSGSLYRLHNGRIVCKEGRPVRAREMRDWFAGRATTTFNGEPDDNQYWAVYQHDSYPGGHVVIHHHRGTSYTSRGTGDYPAWGEQRHYTW